MPVEGLLHIMTKAPQREICVAVGLRDGYLVRLMADDGVGERETQIERFDLI